MPAFMQLLRIASLVLCSGTALAQSHTPGAGVPTATWEPGTLLAQIPHGGRITTFHRGKLYLGGTDNQATWAYDISGMRPPQGTTPAQLPRLLCTGATLGNSHVWYKVGDMFVRQDLAHWGSKRFLDLRTDFCNPSPWTTPIHDFPLNRPSGDPGTDDWMATYPYAFANSVHDARLGWWPTLNDNFNLAQRCGVNISNRFRIGNLALFTPGDGGSGVCAWDIGDPANPRLLDVLPGSYLQYTTTWHVWRHYLVMMSGTSNNGPQGNANGVVIDFSQFLDPAIQNPKFQVAWTIPQKPTPGNTDNYMPGRYVHFQDHYAFAGHVADGRGGGHGVKYDMLTRKVVQTFDPPNTGTDFQWIPIGHVLMVSGSETSESASAFYAHQAGLDRTPPTVGYHLPRNGQAGLPLKTGIGLVINEQLDATTVNETTIQLRKLGSTSTVPSIVIHTSYDVVSVIPTAPLEDDTMYEVKLVANGVRDVAGNGIAEYSFVFSTGDAALPPPQIQSLSVTPTMPALVDEVLTFNAQATNATQYSWDFGDGSAATAWSNSPQAVHDYDMPGTYTVRAQARNAGGEVANATLRLVVDPVPAPAAQAPAASTSILIVGDRVWSVNPDHGSVAVFDAQTRERLAIHAACSDPRSLARDGAGRIWVACRGDDRVVALAADGSMAAQLQTGYGSAPSAVLFDAAGSTGYVSLAGPRSVLRFNASNATEIPGRVALGFSAEALARGGGKLYAARLKSDNDAGRVAAIDLPAFTLAAGAAGAPGIELPLDDTTPDSGTGGRGLPNYVAALAMSPDNSRLWYAAKKDNILRGLARDGAELDFEKTVRVMVGAVRTTSATAPAELLDARFDVDNSALALALAPSPGGAVLFVALTGNDRIVAIDPWQNLELARLDVGAAPRGLAVDAARHRLWVRNDLGRSVSVIDIAPIATQGATGMTLLGHTPSVQTEVLSERVLSGKKIFYRAEDPRMSADGYIACASCHLDGAADSRVWDFTERGEGLRRTLSMQGRAGMAHGPLHWSANFDEMQDFENDIRERFGGTGLMSDLHYYVGTRDQPLGDAKAGLSADLDALTAYTETLDEVGRSPYREADGSLSEGAEQGRALFDRLGCAGCHGGPGFTDSPLQRWHDVGTVTANDMRAARPMQGLDTPTLRGLWHETHYLHDGRGADVLDALSVTPAGRHGAIATLDDDDRARLRAYLLSIDDNEPAPADAPFVLQITAPLAGRLLDPGRPVPLTVDTDVADLQRIEVLLDGIVVATMHGAPWQTQFDVAAASRPQLQLRAVHASGASTYTWPRPLRVAARVGGLFEDGFETLVP